MVSLLQDQASIKFPSSDTLNGDQQDDLMQMQGDSSPPEQQADNPSFSCQAYDLDSRTERKGSDSSHSPSPSSPAHDPLHGRFPASQAIHAARSKFKTTHSLDKFRRYSYDENTAGTYSSFLKSTRNPFHPYKRQISEEVFQESHQALALDDHAFKNASSVETFEELPGSTGTGETEAFPTHVPNISTEQTWCNSLQYNTRGQDPGTQALDSEVSLKGLSLEGQPGLYCYQPQVQETYCSSHPFQQYSPGSSYPVTYLSSSQYPYQRIAPQGSQESHQPLYPKPIYSYSILIFMALKNSKTGSLPVSEIYNFMTEHFPYFKTAPDGWKNSVRHNLSLNKCFEKVENKTGSSSRKGCLWALNPAKIDKMQEELQKWKRKDPVAVRKSMAKPEELDTLIGEKMDKLRPSVMACNPNGVTSSSGVSRQMLVQPHSLCDPSLSSAIPQSLHAIHPPGPLCAKNPLPSLLRGHHSSCYASSQGFPPISTTLMQQSPGIPQTIFPSGDTQSELRAQPSTTQDSPLPAQTPPIHGMKMLTEQSTTRTMQDTLMQDGDLSNDIDALNPSLTDFDLQGNLWEELKDDSLAADPLVLISSSPAPSQCLPPHCQVDGGSSSSTPHASLPDLQLTTLYSAFMEVDAVSTPYLSNPGSKPIALV